MSNSNILFMNALGNAPSLNTRQNIISGPGPLDNWNHSPGSTAPEIHEQGPFPIQGNIGALLTEESVNNFASCSNNLPSIGSSPNCTNTFNKNPFQDKDTCGDFCQVKYPESYGEKDFGISDPTKFNDSHSLKTYENTRVSSPGQSSQDQCLDWIPRVQKDKDGKSCILDQEKVYRQVGAWDKLPVFQNLVNVNSEPNHKFSLLYN